MDATLAASSSLIPSLSDLAWIDQLGLFLISVFGLLGVVRGLWWQVVRLLGVVAAVALARGLSPIFAPTLEEALPSLSGNFAVGTTWFLLFIAGLVLASLLGTLGKKALEAMQLGLVDRVGGALAGAMTGVIVHSALLVVMATLGSTAWSGRTLEGTRSLALLEALSTGAPILIDAQAAERLEEERLSEPRFASDRDQEERGPVHAGKQER